MIDLTTNSLSNIILKVAFSWQISEKARAQFNQSSLLSDISNRLNFHFEEIQNSYLQIWDSLDDFKKTTRYRVETFKNIQSIISNNENLEKIQKNLQSFGMIPQEFPEEGLHVYYDFISNNLPLDFKITDHYKLQEFHPDVEFELIEPRKRFILHFKSFIVFTLVFTILRYDLVKTFLQ